MINNMAKCFVNDMLCAQPPEPLGMYSRDKKKTKAAILCMTDYNISSNYSFKELTNLPRHTISTGSKAPYYFDLKLSVRIK
eukprot:g20285.t1